MHTAEKWEPGSTAPLRVLVVDDEPLVHTLTRMTLSDLSFEGRSLELHTAQSAQEARALLASDPGLVVALVDVVMESDRAGLELVTHIREEMANLDLRIILRTGEAGLAPERMVIAEYDINAYLDKSGTTASRLYGAVLTALRSHREITRLREAMKLIEALAGTDPLTGLSSSKTLHASIGRAINGARRRGEPLSIVFLDIDNFKRINDEQGHLRGDEVLKAVGTAMLSHSRAEDGCFRYGGDEFVAVLPNCTEAQARDRYCQRLGGEFMRLGISASQGIAQTGPSHFDDVDALIRRADADMYERKRASKGLAAGANEGTVLRPMKWAEAAADPRPAPAAPAVPAVPDSAPRAANA